MNANQLLHYIVGYIDGLNTTKSIPRNKFYKIKEAIDSYWEIKKDNLENLVNDENEPINEEYIDYVKENSLYNNPNYDPEIDIDQQDDPF